MRRSAFRTILRVKSLFERIGIEGHTYQVLAKAVMDVLADPGLFAVADLQDLPFQTNAGDGTGSLGRDGFECYSD